jgi:hypothetical protein
LLLLLLYRTTLERQTPAEIMYDGFVAEKLAIVILSFVAFGFLCDLLVFILRLVIIKKERREKRESRRTVSYDSTMKGPCSIVTNRKAKKKPISLKDYTLKKVQMLY